MSSSVVSTGSHCLPEGSQAKSVKMIEQAPAQPQKTREESAWMPKDQNSFSRGIKHWCHFSSSHDLTTALCPLAVSAKHRQLRAGAGSPVRCSQLLETPQGCISIPFLSMQILLKVALN